MLGDLVLVCVVGFVLIAGLSLFSIGPPSTPTFAKRAPTASNPQLRQDANAGFLHDRGFLFRAVVQIGSAWTNVPARSILDPLARR